MSNEIHKINIEKSSATLLMFREKTVIHIWHFELYGILITLLFFKVIFPFFFFHGTSLDMLSVFIVCFFGLYQPVAISVDIIGTFGLLRYQYLSFVL